MWSQWSHINQGSLLHITPPNQLCYSMKLWLIHDISWFTGVGESHEVLWVLLRPLDSKDRYDWFKDLLDTLERRNDMNWQINENKTWRDDNNSTVCGVVLLNIIFSEFSYHLVQWGFRQFWMVLVFSYCLVFVGGAVCSVFCKHLLYKYNYSLAWPSDTQRLIPGLVELHVAQLLEEQVRSIPMNFRPLP